MKYASFLLALALSLQALGQQSALPVRNVLQQPILPEQIHLKSIQQDFAPSVYSLEMPSPGAGTYRAYLLGLKDSLYRSYQPSGWKAMEGDASTPEVLAGFEGNLSGVSVPNDNDMAISNDGTIISVINSNMHVYDMSGNLLHEVSLGAIADTLGGPQSSFDPRVLYDPIHDRFILVFLDGFGPATSFIIVAFSQTSDPTGTWNVYELPGNPKDNNRWTDYPMIAITETELFITGNLIIPDEPWQTGFSETLIWQMSLDSGYNGNALDAVFWDNIQFGGAPIRNLHPVKGGKGPLGPDMYFLSNRNFSPSNDTIFVVRVTDALAVPETTVEVDFALADVNYGVPPQARQFNDHTFDTNDGRILGSFLQNNKIQFVANTLDPATGFCGIYHGIITDLLSDPVVSGNIIGDDTLDLGYPGISFTGRYDDDVQSIITADHSAPEVYAGMSAFFYNYSGYSERVNLKTGDTYVNMLSGTYERWGDYTGSQPKYNEPGVVWVSGNFGKAIDAGPFTDRKNATWIAALRSRDSLPPVALEQEPAPAGMQLYPVPVREWVTADLQLPSGGTAAFYLLNQLGREVAFLVEAKVTAGWNRFTFDMSSLQPGIYLLVAQQDNNPPIVQQVVKQ